MTKTEDIIISILESKCQRKILELLKNIDLGLIELKNMLDDFNNEQILNGLEKNNKFALIEHIHTLTGDYYRISARGRRMLEIIEIVEEEVEENNEEIDLTDIGMQIAEEREGYDDR